jgi:hypothetical protein
MTRLLLAFNSPASAVSQDLRQSLAQFKEKLGGVLATPFIRRIRGGVRSILGLTQHYLQGSLAANIITHDRLRDVLQHGGRH